MNTIRLSTDIHTLIFWCTSCFLENNILSLQLEVQMKFNLVAMKELKQVI